MKHSFEIKNFKIGEENTILWWSANNTLTEVRKLTTTHINNILKCFQNGTTPDVYCGEKEGWERVLNNELKRRESDGKSRRFKK